MREVYDDNVEAGMAGNVLGGGPTDEGTNGDGCETSPSENEWPSTLRDGIRTEVDRVFSSSVFLDKNKVFATLDSEVFPEPSSLFPDRAWDRLHAELSYHTDRVCDMSVISSSRCVTP